MNVVYRKAVPQDTEDCIALRGQTRENAFSVEALEALGITLESWREGIRSGALPGHVGTVDGRMVGYCFGDRDSGEIVVLALLPACEGLGIGKTLLALVVEELQGLGFARLFLGCSADPAVRSHGFYRHLGWQPTGSFDAAGDEVLEYLLPAASPFGNPATTPRNNRKCLHGRCRQKKTRVLAWSLHPGPTAT